MRYLSIDVGYKNLGWCVFEIDNGNFIYLSSGYIGTNDKKSYPEEFDKQLKFIYDFFKNIIESCNIKSIVYEKPYFKTGDIGAKVTNVVGVLILLCGMYDLKEYSYNAITVKKTVSNDAKADKHKVDCEVCKFLNINPNFKTDHESDAVAVGITHFKSIF